MSIKWDTSPDLKEWRKICVAHASYDWPTDLFRDNRKLSGGTHFLPYASTGQPLYNTPRPSSILLRPLRIRCRRPNYPQSLPAASTQPHPRLSHLLHAPTINNTLPSQRQRNIKSVNIHPSTSKTTTTESSARTGIFPPRLGPS